jgi:nucleoside-diphosphate-sugar epimerase
MKILITGAAGYIGSSLCQHIIKTLPNAKIVGFDNLYYNQWEYVKSYLEHPQIDFYNEDILDWSNNLINHIKTADYIICLAAIVGAPACDKIPALSTNINYTWYTHLLKQVTGRQKILYPNTNSGYGTTPEGSVCTESSPSNPISLYGKLKQNTELLLLKEYNNVVCFRLATVFVLSGRPRLDLLVNNFVYKVSKTNKLDIYDGNFRRNFISVHDICRAFVFGINNFDQMRGQVYNLGADSLNSTKLDFAKQIQKVLGCEIVEHNEKTDPDKRDYLVSSQKLYDLGFNIEDTTLDRNIIELYDFCKDLTDTTGMFNY